MMQRNDAKISVEKSTIRFLNYILIKNNENKHKYQS